MNWPVTAHVEGKAIYLGHLFVFFLLLFLFFHGAPPISRAVAMTTRGHFAKRPCLLFIGRAALLWRTLRGTRAPMEIERRTAPIDPAIALYALVTLY